MLSYEYRQSSPLGESFSPAVHSGRTADTDDEDVLTVKVHYRASATLELAKWFRFAASATVAEVLSTVARKLKVELQPSHALYDVNDDDEPLAAQATLEELDLFSGSELALRLLPAAAVTTATTTADGETEEGDDSGAASKPRLVRLRRMSTVGVLTACVAIRFDQSDTFLSRLTIESTSVRTSIHDGPASVLEQVFKKIALCTSLPLRAADWALFLYSPKRLHPWELIDGDRSPLRVLVEAQKEESRAGKQVQSSLWLRRAASDLRRFQNVERTEGLGVKTYVTVKQARFAKLPDFQLPPGQAPFDTDYVDNHALWLASAAVLVYASDDESSQVVRRIWDMPTSRFFYEPSTDTQALGFCNDDFIVVAFRGTDSAEDWKTNLSFRKEPLRDCMDELRGSKIAVHGGFQSAFLSVRDAVERWLYNTAGKRSNPDKPLYIAGHSLGGALSVLLFAYLTLCRSAYDPAAPRMRVNGVYTLGQPRVGNAALGRELAARGGCVLQRLVNSNDCVPLVGRGRHFGQVSYFNAVGRLLRQPNFFEKDVRITRMLRGDLGIAAHWSPLYLRLVERHHHELQTNADQGLCSVLLTVHGAALPHNRAPSYCTVRCGAKHATTSAVWDGADATAPRWQHTVHITDASVADCIVVSLHGVTAAAGSSLGGRSRFLGMAGIPLDSMATRCRNVLELQPRPGHPSDAAVAGTLCVSTQVTAVPVAVAAHTPRAFVVVHRVLDLLQCNAGTAGPATRLRVRWGNAYHLHSPTAACSYSPDYEFSFDIFAVSVYEQLEIDVWLDGSDSSLAASVVEFDSGFNNAEHVVLELFAKKASSRTTCLGHLLASFRFEHHPAAGPPAAAATVTVHSAAGLVCADAAAAVYVVASCTHAAATVRAHKTRPVQLSPAGHAAVDESFAVALHAGCTLTFDVFEKSYFGADGFLGRVALPLKVLERFAFEPFTLYGRSFRDVVAGTLAISIDFHAS